MACIGGVSVCGPAAGLPGEVVRVLYKCCTTDARAVANIWAACSAWRSAADSDLFKELIARRWGQDSVDMERGVARNWRTVFFDRALGRGLRRTSLEAIDLSEVLGKRLAPKAFTLHPSGWAIFTQGGRTFCAKIKTGAQVLSLAFDAKILVTSGPADSTTAGGGSFLIDRPGVKWDTDNSVWLVVSTRRNALALFRIADAGFSRHGMGCSGSGGVWESFGVFPEPSPVLAVAVNRERLASVSKLNKGTGSLVRVRNLPASGGAASRPGAADSLAALRTPEEILSVCWLPRGNPIDQGGGSGGGSGEHLVCGTAPGGRGGGEVLILYAHERSLVLKHRLSPPGARLSRVEGPFSG